MCDVCLLNGNSMYGILEEYTISTLYTLLINFIKLCECHTMHMCIYVHTLVYK